MDVVLYGATGYTGRLIAAELAAADASFAIAGRSAHRLADLAGELEADPPQAAVSLDEPDRMKRLAAQGEVLVTAAGPFTELGPPALQAAMGAGRHYVDITGEQGWMREAAERDADARRAGVAAVNAMGFDVVPTDVAARVAADGLDEVESVDLGIGADNRLSGGTRRTMAATTGDWWVYEDGEYKPSVPGRRTRTFDVPDDAPFDTGVFVPWGDVATAHRSTGAENVRTYFLLPPKVVRKIHWTWPIQWIAARIPGLPKLLEKRAPGPRTGPSVEERRESSFVVVAEATSPDGQVSRAVVRGRDPYGLTGAAAARGGLALVRDEVDERGVLTPTQAFGVDRLEKMLSDFDLEVEGPLLEDEAPAREA